MKYSLLRYFICCLLCSASLFYCGYSVLFEGEKTPQKDIFAPTFSENGELSVDEICENTANTVLKPQESSSKEQVGEESSKTQTTSQNTQNGNVTDADAVAIKGKVVKKYISPYSAPLSYGSVYMKNSTDKTVNIKNLLNAKLKFKIQKNNEPQVLILHTHATETFLLEDTPYYTEDYTSRTTDNSKNMVAIGKKVAEKLNSAGIKTVQSATHHDYPEYTGSYSRSAKTVNEYLKKYPSIKIVIDLHRDAVSAGDNAKTKLVTEIKGKNAAQVMLVMGCQSGSVKNHPNWQENLKLAVKLQQTMEMKYPTLARPLLLMPKSYNQPLSNGALLIEIGTDVNTLDEALYSAELVGESLVSLLNTLK